MTSERLLLLDCDSTLSAIEGIDELARFRGFEVCEAVEAMTRGAMDGGVPMEAIFQKRLDMIQPTEAEMAKIGAMYIANAEPDAKTVVAKLQAEGWQVVIVSGGFLQAIEPFAKWLGIQRVEAVRVLFDEAGNYAGFDQACPTARSFGKNEVARRLRAEYSAQWSAMVGDGASDLEVKGDVDCVIGFGRYAVRDKVKLGADAFIFGFGELPKVLEDLLIK